jgi:photosystem II stability/assembly factor-like uncharacterized protein
MKTSALSLLLATASIFLAPTGASAQTWVPMGPPGGDVRSLAADPRDPRRIYLGTADGVLYRSDDAGLRWRRLHPGFPRRGQSLDDLVVDRRGAVIVGFWEVSGSGGGVARSTDGGKTFSLLPGIEGQAVRALALAGPGDRTLLVGTLGGVFRSRDGGESWERISPADHPELRNVGSVAVDADNPDVIYAGTWHLPWKTEDGGLHWKPVHQGMIDDSDVMTLTLDRRSPQSVFATACSGIYRSADGAGRWARIRGIPASSRRTRAFAQSPDDLNTFFAGTTAGLWISTDGSATWRLATRADLVVNAVALLPGGVALLGTDGAGVLRSVDGGRTWLASNNGFSERFVSALAFDESSGRTLAAVWGDRKHGGVFATARTRASWMKVGGGLEGREVLTLAVTSGLYLAGTDDGVFVWPSSEGRWQRMAAVVAGVDLHPRVNGIVAFSERSWLIATNQGLLRTVDAGQTWMRPSLGPRVNVSALAVSPADLARVVAATPLGFFRSEDQGDRWMLVSRGLGDGQAHALRFLPTDPAVVFATTSRGLWRSPDLGESWRQVAGGVPFTDITGLAIHPDGRTLFASDFTWGGIFRSHDAGQSWQRLPANGLVTDRVWTMALDPAAPERLLAATPSGGLHLLELPVRDPSSAEVAGSQPE